MRVIYVPWIKALRMCYELAAKILRSGRAFDAVVTISRGGLIPARIVSDVLGVEDLYVIRSKLWGVGGKLFDKPLIRIEGGINVKGRRVLIIDEVVDTGSTMSEVIRIVKGLGASSIASGVLHYKLTSTVRPDYYVEEVREWAWIFYPWSLSETLYSLASRVNGCVIDEALRIAESLGAGEGLLERDDLRLSIERYFGR